MNLLHRTFLAHFLAGALSAAPVVTTLVPVDGSTVGTLTSLSVTFNEPVTGLDANDLSINSESALAVSGSGAGPYIFTFTQPPPGAVGISWEVDHGITGIGTGEFAPAGGYSYTLTDNIAPVLIQMTPANGSTMGVLAEARVSFSESVTGVDPADLRVNGAAAATVSGSGAGPYIFTFTQPAAGAVNFTWSGGHGITDVAGNEFGGAGWSVTRSAAGAGSVVINEILAINGTGIADEDGEQNDWIEIRNTGATAVNLAGWSLTDDENDLRKWVFPSRTLGAGSYLLIFASAKNRAPPSGNLHTNFKLGDESGRVILLPPDSPASALPASFNPYPAQRNDYSYGTGAGGALFYFTPPTPNSANAAGTLTTIAQKPHASVARGFFKDPISVILTTTTPGATIRYTLDGTVPTVASTAYTGPLNVTATTILRAATFATNFVPSETVTHSYIYLDNIFSQPSPPYDNPLNATDNANPQPPSVGGFILPVKWGTSSTGAFPGQITNLATNDVPADYGMDPKIVSDPNKYDDTGAINPTTGKTNLERMKAALRELPILSIVMPPADMWGTGGAPGTALYPNSSESSKPDLTKPCSIEMLLPDGSTAFATTCGIDIHGNASRAPYKNPKHGFTLKFKRDYGPGTLDYELFTDSPVKKHDKLILRADFNSSWRHWDNANDRPYSNRVRDAWCKDTFRAMGRAAGHHRYVNLFINGIYWGSYDLAEDEGDNFGADYFGGDKSDYDVIEQGILKSGTKTFYDAMVAIAAPIDNTKYEQMKTYLDVVQHCDYTLLHFFLGHTDWATNINKNWYASRNWKTNGTFKFHPWDMENVLRSPTENRTTVSTPPAGLHSKLTGNAQYRLDFADRVHKHMVSPDGALLPSANIARLDKWNAIMNAGQQCLESARWGDYRRDVHRYTANAGQVYTWNGRWFEGGVTQTGTVHWLAETSRLKNTYFPGRTATVMDQLRAVGLYPAVNAPEIRDNSTNTPIASQIVPAGFVVKFANVTTPPSGTANATTFYYTTNGADPRVYYSGAISGSATAAAPNDTLTINATTTLKVRAFNGTTWSALNEQTFHVGAQALIPPVRITEIMFNPPGSVNDEAKEYVELRNTGTYAVDISNWYFGGMDCIIPQGTILNPGTHLLLANNDNPAVFAATYPGAAVGAYFGGQLDNGGERITLYHRDGRIIVSVDYDDGWHPAADGGGASLEIIAPSGDPDDPGNWQASAVTGGTPGTANGPPAAPPVLISEFLVRNTGAYVTGGFTPGYVELFNPGGSPVNIGGWRLSDSAAQFDFPPGTVIPAGGYAVVNFGAAGAPGFSSPDALAGNGTAAPTLVLSSSPTTIVDRVRRGPQAPDYAFGKVAGAWTLTTPTPGAANVAAPTAPQGSLRINEWLAGNSGGADWLELYNTHATLPVPLMKLFAGAGGELFQINALSAVAPQGWARLFCNKGSSRTDALDFNLPLSGTTLRILDAAGTLADTISYGEQTTDVSHGRLPDGSATITALAHPSPGVANHAAISGAPQLNEILAININGSNAPWARRPAWIELRNPGGAAIALGGWRLRLGDGNAEWAFPTGTSIAPGAHLAVWADPLHPPSLTAGLHLNAALPLLPVPRRLELLNPAGQVADSVVFGRQIADYSIGRTAGGEWALLAAPTRGNANTTAATTGPVSALRLNEWGAQGTELFNTSALPVPLAGLAFSDDPSEVGRRKFIFGPLSFIGGAGYAAFSPGETSFNVSTQGDSLLLAQGDGTLIDSVNFGAIGALPASMGRQPDGSAGFTLLTATHGLANVTGSGPVVTAVSDSLAVPADGMARISASAVNATSYQWMHDGVPVGGAGGVYSGPAADLSFSPVQGAHDGVYTCVFTGPGGSATSPPVRLTVLHTFDTWAASHGIAGALAGDDHDGDGIADFAEFIANTSPVLAATPAERATAHLTAGVEFAGNEPVALTLEFRLNRRAAFTALDGELANSLPGPFVPSMPALTELLGTEPNGDERWRYTYPVSGGAQRFIQMRFTK